MQMSAAWLSIRPKTLVAAIVPVVASASLATALGYGIHWGTFVSCLLVALFLQIAVNLFNDAIDFKKGVDSQDRLGPQRVTASGLASFRTVMVWGMLMVVAAMLVAIPLILRGGAWFFALGIVAALSAYFYTGSSRSLSSLGLGEVFVLIFFGWVAVAGSLYLQTLKWYWEGMVLATQIGCLSAVLISINNLRDYESDKKAGRKTLAYRMGIDDFKKLIGIFLFLPFLFQFYWMIKGYLLAALFPLMMLKIAIGIFQSVLKQSPSRVYNEFLAQSAQLLLGFGLLLVIGFWSPGL
jgi:1,4-dihydroxy-2-naphthoate polyprenyltransferase